MSESNRERERERERELSHEDILTEIIITRSRQWKAYADLFDTPITNRTQIPLNKVWKTLF